MKPIRTLLVATAIAAVSATAAAQRPPEVVVRTGGIGAEERAALEAERARYNLRLAFAETDGQYLSDVHVRLTRLDGGVVYEGDAEGPFLFARLPAGRYRLEAEYAGITQLRTLDVAGTQARPLVYLHWPAGAAPRG